MKKNKKIVKKQSTKQPKISKKIIAKRNIQGYLAKRNNKIIVGNWKTNKKFSDIKAYAFKFNGLIRRDKVLKKLNFIIGIAPTTIGLLPVSGLMGKYVSPVAQFVSPMEKGSYTGQVSYDQVHEYNVNYAIVGHSETRKYLNISDTFCRNTIRALLKANMRPILCIGEDLKQYEAGKSKKILMLQLMNCLKELDEYEIRQTIIAYEPIWAIGEKAANSEWIVSMIKFIRKSIYDLFDHKTSKSVHVLYGGSVNTANAKEILSLEGVDGVLVGGASLKPDQFYEIICATPEYAYARSIICPSKSEKKKSK